jgi:hypothetical protein
MPRRAWRAPTPREHSALSWRLEDTLAGRARENQDHHPERTQLTAEQAAALLSVLTDGKRVSVINAPAGSGKTRVMTEAARVWAAAGRPVVGITPSQSARNTLAAGVPGSYNAAQFLGHLPGQRGARGPLDISEGTLLLVVSVDLALANLKELRPRARQPGTCQDSSSASRPPCGQARRRAGRVSDRSPREAADLDARPCDDRP